MKNTFLLFFIFFCFSNAFSLEFMDVKDVRSGMKGYGLSVFSGWEPEKFGVEIIDVIKNSNPGGDIILARLSGPDVEKSGVAAGMSGSPVYIGDKLIGAVAYTWAYTKEPLCGITPIKQIISEKDHNDPPASMAGGADNFKQISTPLLINGFTGRGEETVRKMFDNYFVMNTGDSVKNSGSVSGHPELKAGDSVAVNLVDGDYNVEGIGTVTYVSNDDIYIFGHPMDLAGKVSIPISRSYIYTVVSSSYFSFKLGTSSEPLGAVVYDGQNGVYCRRGKDFDMVPVSMDVINAGLSHHYNFRVADSRYYFPALCSGALSSAMLNHTGYLDDKTINLKYDIDIEYKGRFYRAQNSLKYSFNPAYLSVYGMISDLNLLFASFYDNNIGGIKIKGMRIGIDITEGLDYYIVDNLTVDRNKYFPGDTIRVRVLLKKYGSIYEQKDFEIKVPEGTRPGQYWLVAGSEPYFYGEAGKLFPKYYAVNDIDDLVREMGQKQDITRLAAGITFASQGVMVNDKRLEKFPLNYQFLFGFNKPWDRANPMLFPGWIMNEIPMEKAVFGLLKVSVNIEEKQSINPE
ncbi:MAG: hypothetical protein ABSG94_02865 [Brevinematales bacterium]